MGMSLAPTIANLYVAIYEEMHVLNFIPSTVRYLCRFIDDGFGVWLHDPDPTVDERNWKDFQDCLNASGLKWIFSDRFREVVFMDLRLKIEGRHITTSLYAKPMALHLYLPPHSCHAPGVLSGLVFVNVLRIHQLCLDAKDVMKELKLFFHRLLDRGYQKTNSSPSSSRQCTMPRRTFDAQPWTTYVLGPRRRHLIADECFSTCHTTLPIPPPKQSRSFGRVESPILKANLLSAA